MSHATNTEICSVGLISSCPSGEGQGGIPHPLQAIFDTEVLREWLFGPVLLCFFAATTLGFVSSSLV